VTNTLTVSNQNIRLTSIPVAPQSFGVSARRIYRTATSGTVYKLLTTINDNTTTTYDDAIADAALGATAPTDNGVAPKYNACVYHQNRLWVNDPSNLNYVFYSNLGEPHTFPTTNFIKVGDNSSDLVRGFAVGDNVVYVFCDKSVWAIYITDPSDATTWKTIKVNSNYGSKSPYGIVNVNQEVFFPAMENDKFVGFALVAGASTKPDSTLLTVSAAGSDLISNRIQPDMYSVQKDYAANISSIVFKNKCYTTLTYDTGNTTNNRVYVYDFSIDNLSKKQKAVWVPYTGWSPAQFCIWNGSLYFGSSTANGYVYQAESSQYNDDGAAINSYAWTKEFTGYEGEFSFNKDYRYCRMLVDLAGAYSMDVTYLIDSDKGSGNTEQVDLDPGGSVWGVMVWGVDIWGGGSYQDEKQIYLAGARGRRIQFKFSNQNTVNQRFKVHWFSFAYNLKGFR
jgi:hypothetical protein